MNNEPVAWRTLVDGKSYVTDDNEFVVKMWRHNGWKEEPLYTHPAKEQDESFDRTASHMVGEYVSYPVKELSDEVIQELAEYHGIDSLYEAGRLDFARAILRKAQEK